MLDKYNIEENFSQILKHRYCSLADDAGRVKHRRDGVLLVI